MFSTAYLYQDLLTRTLLYYPFFSSVHSVSIRSSFDPITTSISSTVTTTADAHPSFDPITTSISTLLTAFAETHSTFSDIRSQIIAEVIKVVDVAEPVIIARLVGHNVSVAITPKSPESAQSIRNIQPGSFVSLLYVINNNSIQLNRIDLSSDFVTQGNSIHIKFNNPIYTTNLKILYNIQTLDKQWEDEIDVLHLNENKEKGLELISNDMNIEPETINTDNKVTPFSPILLLDIDFNSIVPVKVGNALNYLGGGNRFMLNDAAIQSINQIPSVAYSEIATSNLITNDFETLEGYTVETTDFVKYSLETFTHTSLNIKGLQLTLYDSTRINQSLKLNTPKVAVDENLPVTFWAFFGIETLSTIRNVNINFRCYQQNTLVETIVRTCDKTLILNTLGVLKETLNVLPQTTDFIQVQIELVGIDKGERFVIQSLLPQLNQTLIQTTPIVNINSREGDVFFVENVSFGVEGLIEINVTLDIENFAVEGVLFENAMNSGRILADKRIEFSFGEQVIVTETLLQEDVSTIGFSWGENYRRIYVNNVLMLEDTNSYTCEPDVSDIYIGCNMESSEQINGKINTFKVFG